MWFWNLAPTAILAFPDKKRDRKGWLGHGSNCGIRIWINLTSKWGGTNTSRQLFCRNFSVTRPTVTSRQSNITTLRCSGGARLSVSTSAGRPASRVPTIRDRLPVSPRSPRGLSDAASPTLNPKSSTSFRRSSRPSRPMPSTRARCCWCPSRRLPTTEGGLRRGIGESDWDCRRAHPPVNVSPPVAPQPPLA